VSRSMVMPTYAEVLRYTGWPDDSDAAQRRLLSTGAYTATVTVGPSSAFVLVQAEGPSRPEATMLARGIAGRGAAHVNGEPALAGLASATVGRPTAERTRDWSVPQLALAACAVPVALWGIGLVRRLRRGP
jgi:hypothetical protein